MYVKDSKKGNQVGRLNRRLEDFFLKKFSGYTHYPRS